MSQLRCTLTRQGQTLGFATKSSISHLLAMHTDVGLFESAKKSVFTIPTHLICSWAEAACDSGSLRTDAQAGRMNLKIHSPFPLGLAIDGEDARIMTCCFEQNGQFMKLKTAYPKKCSNCE